MADVTSLVSQMNETLSTIQETLSSLDTSAHDSQLDELERKRDEAVSVLRSAFYQECKTESQKRRVLFDEIAERRRKEDEERERRRKLEDEEIARRVQQEDEDRRVRLEDETHGVEEEIDEEMGRVEEEAIRLLEEGKERLRELEDRRREINRQINERFFASIPTFPSRRKTGRSGPAASVESKRSASNLAYEFRGNPDVKAPEFGVVYTPAKGNDAPPFTVEVPRSPSPLAASDVAVRATVSEAQDLGISVGEGAADGSPSDTAVEDHTGGDDVIPRDTSVETDDLQNHGVVSETEAAFAEESSTADSHTRDTMDEDQKIDSAPNLEKEEEPQSTRPTSIFGSLGQTLKSLVSGQTSSPEIASPPPNVGSYAPEQADEPTTLPAEDDHDDELVIGGRTRPSTPDTAPNTTGQLGESSPGVKGNQDSAAPDSSETLAADVDVESSTPHEVDFGSQLAAQERLQPFSHDEGHGSIHSDDHFAMTGDEAIPGTMTHGSDGSGSEIIEPIAGTMTHGVDHPSVDVSGLLESDIARNEDEAVRLMPQLDKGQSDIIDAEPDLTSDAPHEPRSTGDGAHGIDQEEILAEESKSTGQTPLTSSDELGTQSEDKIDKAEQAKPPGHMHPVETETPLAPPAVLVKDTPEPEIKAALESGLDEVRRASGDDGSIAGKEVPEGPESHLPDDLEAIAQPEFPVEDESTRQSSDDSLEPSSVIPPDENLEVDSTDDTAGESASLPTAETYLVSQGHMAENEVYDHENSPRFHDLQDGGSIKDEKHDTILLEHTPLELEASGPTRRDADPDSTPEDDEDIPSQEHHMQPFRDFRNNGDPADHHEDNSEVDGEIPLDEEEREFEHYLKHTPHLLWKPNSPDSASAPFETPLASADLESPMDFQTPMQYQKSWPGPTEGWGQADEAESQYELEEQDTTTVHGQDDLFDDDNRSDESNGHEDGSPGVGDVQMTGKSSNTSSITEHVVESDLDHKDDGLKTAVPVMNDTELHRDSQERDIGTPDELDVPPGSDIEPSSHATLPASKGLAHSRHNPTRPQTPPQRHDRHSYPPEDTDVDSFAPKDVTNIPWHARTRSDSMPHSLHSESTLSSAPSSPFQPLDEHEPAIRDNSWSTPPSHDRLLLSGMGRSRNDSSLSTNSTDLGEPFRYDTKAAAQQWQQREWAGSKNGSTTHRNSIASSSPGGLFHKMRSIFEPVGGQSGGGSLPSSPGRGSPTASRRRVTATRDGDGYDTSSDRRGGFLNDGEDEEADERSTLLSERGVEVN